MPAVQEQTMKGLYSAKKLPIASPANDEIEYWIHATGSEPMQFIFFSQATKLTSKTDIRSIWRCNATSLWDNAAKALDKSSN